MGGGGPAGAGARRRSRARAGGGRPGGAGGGRADRANWDAPYIISPHSPTRLYWASNTLYRSDDRGDTWTRDQPAISRAT